MNTDWIELTGMSLRCIVGLLERERRNPQQLDVELALGLDLDGAAGGDLSQSVDYAAVADQVHFLAAHGRWRLLESLAAAICRLVLAPPAVGEGRAQVDRVRVRLRKPEVLLGLAVPGVEQTRAREWCLLSSRTPVRGSTIDVLQETDRGGAYRVHLDPGVGWRSPGLAVHVVAGAVVADGELLEPGATGTSAESLENPRGVPATLVAVARPPLAG